MRYSISPQRTRSSDRRERIGRGSLLTAIITIHLLVLLWLLTRPPTVQLARDNGHDLVLISVSPGKRPAPKAVVPKPTPQVAMPTPPIALPSPIPVKSGERTPSPDSIAPPDAGGAGGCALASVMAAAIAKDPAAMAELAALPPAYRTAADAVMLWNGEWLTIASGSTALPVAPSLRRAVEQAVAEAKPECSGAMMSGPQFLAIPEPGRVTTLVIGSGAWRWSELVTSDTSCLGTATESCGAQTPRP